jgi:asparagine synthase (glutamine-hydrolysing)
MELWPEAALGHRRLSILDLSEAGKQPMISEDGQIGLVFNGCIYNFQEIRKELESYDYHFRSHTDTEVLLHGYRQWGIDGLIPRLRGMFAFGIWDNRQRKLTLVRDRLGVKPLVYAANRGQIAFASTITALREGGFVEEIDPQAVLEFLEFGWVSDDLSIYAGARKVPAATIVEWHNGDIRERCYWTPPRSGSRKISFDQAADETEALLLEAVKLRLVADVPVGALLSGGIDSTLVAWAMAKLNANVKSFTVSAAGHPSDESADARKTARILGIPHEVIELSSTDQPALHDLASAYGEPFACSSALAMLQVCKAVKPKATVLLTGDGGDDVFLGYTHHRNFLYAQRLARILPRGAARMWPFVRPAVAQVPALRRAMHLTDYAVGGLGAVTRIHDGLPYYEKACILGQRLANRHLAHRMIAPSFESGRHLMEEFLEYERRTRFVAEYMTKVDGGAMYYSIEARSPFLDQVLWEHAASLPIDMRLRGGGLKPVLRALVRRNVGAEAADRKKQGFTVPVGNWLTQGWRPQLNALTRDTLLEQQGWIRGGGVSDAVAAAVSAGHVPVQLWTLIVLENWLRTSRTPAGVGAQR